MKTFSQRKGLKTISEIIQLDGMNDDLRNSLWNILCYLFWENDEFYDTRNRINIEGMSKDIWSEFFKLPIDGRPSTPKLIIDTIRKFFFSCEWNIVYDFIEFIVNLYGDKLLGFTELVNNVLEKELSGYRFAGKQLTDITNEEELSMIEEAVRDSKYAGVSGHIQSAIEHYSNQEKPDYRNSIKESISAVESMARIISGKTNATLGDAIKEIEKKGNLHPALKEGFLKLYGYTSDEGGIRHSMVDIPNLGSKEARYFLVTCSAFVNYLKESIQ